MSSGVVVKSAIFCKSGGDCFAGVAVPAAQSSLQPKSQNNMGGANGLSAVRRYTRDAFVALRGVPGSAQRAYRCEFARAE